MGDSVTVGFFAGCAVYCGLSLSNSGAYGRYLTAAIVCGAILSGRLVGRIASMAGAWRRSESTRRHVVLATIVAMVVIGLAASAGDVATYAATLEAKRPPQQAIRLARYLERHHLDNGVADYWSASIVTVESGGEVTVRPVIATNGRLVRYPRQSDAGWYGNRFEFLVYNKRQPWGGVNLLSAYASFGPPRQVVSLGPYRIFLWGHHIDVPPDGAPGPAPSRR